MTMRLALWSAPQPRTDSVPTASGVFPKAELPKPSSAEELQRAVVKLTGLNDQAERNHGIALLCVQTIEQLAIEEGPDGLWESIGAVAPRLWPRIVRLRDEHDQIRLLASTLYHYARTGAPQAMVHMSLERLNDAIRIHAERETALVQDALLVDLGR